jgi:DNA-3-methyladenine glycosylase II
MIFSGGDRQIRTYEQGIFCALEIQGMPVLVEIFSKGTVEEPELYLSVHTDNSLSKGKIVFIRSLISSMFNLNEDLTPFYQAMETDAIMMNLLCKLRGIGWWTAELTLLRGCIVLTHFRLMI